MWPGGSPSAVKSAAGLTTVALIIAALYVGRDLLIPLALAGLLSFILAPLVRRLADWGLPRGPAVAIVVAAVVAALLGSTALAGREVGIVRSPCMSPTFEAVIAMAAIDRGLCEVGQRVDVAVGGDVAGATVAPFPLYDTEKRRPRS